MITIADLPTEPKYTIKTVCNQTGIRPVTLRAWERRHEVLTPYRSENRYRLYSERDIAVLRWLKSRVDEGISISNAANEMRSMLQSGMWPEVSMPEPAVRVMPSGTPPGEYATQLYEALIQHNEARSGDLLRSAAADFDLLTLCQMVLVPTLSEIGEAWYTGRIRVATEHFASTYIRGRLLAMMQTFPTHRGAPQILVGCAPMEQHEIGPLMLALLLRQSGYRIEFLGPDIPLDDLVDYADFEHPAMIILSATLPDSAEELRGLQARLTALDKPVLFGYGGRAFNLKPKLRDSSDGTFLGATFESALMTTKELLPIKQLAI